MTSIPSTSLRDFVRQHIKEHWETKGQPLLLAKLGQAAVAQGINLRDALGDRKLAEFIEQELRDEVDVEPSYPSSKQLQAKPAGAPATTTEQTASKDGGGLRLNRALWLAFSRPIASSYERRLQVEPVVRFWDLTPPLAEVAGRLPVAPSYIAPPADGSQSGTRDDAVLENIRKWMRDNGLDISKFENGRQAAAVAAPRMTENNPLMQLIAALDEGELKRVSLPLDVIAKLLKK